MQAIWNNHIVAVSADTVELEGHHYFPPEAVLEEYLRPSATVTHCPLKGEAHYYTLAIDGEIKPDAAWCYPEPKEAVQQIRGRIAFCEDVKIVDAL